jgi:hypothetical protein
VESFGCVLLEQQLVRWCAACGKLDETVALFLFINSRGRGAIHEIKNHPISWIKYDRCSKSRCHVSCPC